MVTLLWKQLTWFSEYVLYQATLRRVLIVVGFFLALIVGGVGTLLSHSLHATHAHHSTSPADTSQKKRAALQRILSASLTTPLQTLAEQASTHGLVHIQTQYHYHRIHSTLQAIEIEMQYHADSIASQRFIFDALVLLPSLLLVEVHMHKDLSKNSTAEIHTIVHFRLLTQ